MIANRKAGKVEFVGEDLDTQPGSPRRCHPPVYAVAAPSGSALTNDFQRARGYARSGRMRKGIEVRLGPGDRERLVSHRRVGNSPQKHVWRARIVLLSAEGVGTMAIQRQTGKGKPTIWRWQARFLAEGVDGLLHEATRPAGKPPLPVTTIERVVEMTLADPPDEDALDRPGDGQGRWGQPSQRAADLGGACRLSLTGSRPSSCRTIRSLPPRCRMSSASMSILPSTRWCCRSMRSRKSRRSTAPSRDCR